MSEQQGFVFFEWVKQARDGLSILRQRKKSLEQEREAIEVSLIETNKEILALEAMLSAHGDIKVTTEESPPPRVRGIRKVLTSIAKELAIGVDWDENDLIEMVIQELPDAKTSSIQGALRILAKEGVFEREMVNGRFLCKTKIGKWKKIEDDPPPHREKPTLEEQVMEEDCAKTVDQADVIIAIEKEMKKRKTFAIGDKNISWIAADLKCDPKMVRNALKVLVATMDLEIAYEGDAKVLRHKAEPGSKEELKRIPIKDNPLFPEADRPQHA